MPDTKCKFLPYYGKFVRGPIFVLYWLSWKLTLQISASTLIHACTLTYWYVYAHPPKLNSRNITTHLSSRWFPNTVEYLPPKIRQSSRMIVLKFWKYIHVLWWHNPAVVLKYHSSCLFHCLLAIYSTLSMTKEPEFEVSHSKGLLTTWLCMSVHKAKHMQVMEEKNGIEITYFCSVVTVTRQNNWDCEMPMFQVNGLLSPNIFHILAS